MCEKRKPDFLDVLAEAAGTPYLSDLRSLKEDARRKLAEKLEALTPEDYPLAQWNDALNYLFAELAQSSPEAARKRLLAHYLNSNSPKEEMI